MKPQMWAERETLRMLTKHVFFPAYMDGLIVTWENKDDSREGGECHLLDEQTHFTFNSKLTIKTKQYVWDSFMSQFTNPSLGGSSYAWKTASVDARERVEQHIRKLWIIYWMCLNCTMSFRVKFAFERHQMCKFQITTSTLPQIKSLQFCM